MSFESLLLYKGEGTYYKVLKIVSLILLLFLLLFGKTLFVYVMGFLFFGSPDEEFIMNEIGEPCIVGESWAEEDFFQVTVTAITFSESD